MSDTITEVTDQYLTPAQIASRLQISVDSVYRLFSGRPGVLNLGSPERLHKRKYSLLRIPSSAFTEFIQEHSE